jgi:hypothetical protein
MNRLPKCFASLSIVIVVWLAAWMAPLRGAETAFRFQEIGSTGLELSEHGKPVFVYNFGMMLAPGAAENMRRSSYIHPVYAPDGTLLSDDFNPNHVHHRGIFWAWPDITVDSKKGDIWTLKPGFQQRFVGWKARDAAGLVARLAVENGWFDGDRKFVNENVEILTHPAEGNRRVLDFTLSFEATDRPVRIVGTSEGKKGFGGFAFRFATPDGGGDKTVIRTEQGISEKDGVFARHPWAEISGIYQGKAAGARVEDTAANPGYPNNGWLMRHQLCCLNVSYPGLEPLTLLPGKPLVLKYRVILFAGAGPDAGAGLDAKGK